MVTAEQLRKLYYAEPFEPFVIALGDGRRITITEPIFFSINDNRRTVNFPGGPGWIDWASFDDVTIEPVPVRTRRRRRAS